MYGVILLLVVAMLSLLITRIATIALTATGMPRPSARFQARSALTGVGFTTTESEAVVAHPARRRIIMALMLVGSVGLATSIAGILGGMVGGADTGDRLTRAVVLIGGLGCIYWISMSKRVDRRLSSVIGRGLARFTDLDVRDYAALLHVSGEYEVKELLAAPGSWVAGVPVAGPEPEGDASHEPAVAAQEDVADEEQEWERGRLGEQYRGCARPLSAARRAPSPAKPP